ncbi:MAG: hypothetical protein P1V35_15350 [Planctomycetota bacterium]|nr:hypothetical protein [Planctomycetota bacterium]
MRHLIPAFILLSGFASAQVSINEIRVGEVGPNLNDYFELRVAPGTSLGGLTYVVLGVNASGGSGVIEVAVPLPAIVPSDPFFLVGESTMTLAVPDHVAVLDFPDQQNATHFLVSGFTGAVGQDLDPGDDWVLDTTPWTGIVDGVSFFSSNGGITYPTYAASTVGIDAVPNQPTLHTGKFSYGWFIMPDDFSADTPGEDNGGGPAVDILCWDAQPNAGGLSAQMFGSYSAAAGSGLHLEVVGGEHNTFGYILVGSGNGSHNPLMISNGLLCLSTAPGNWMGRYNVYPGEFNSVGIFDSAGVMQNLGGTSSTGSGFDVPANLPIPGSPMIQAGQAFYFQCWYRESVFGVSNFSTMLKVSF